MSDLAYILPPMGEGNKPLVWLHGEIKTPPCRCTPAWKLVIS